MRRGQPNMFLAFDRRGIDPFTQRFPVTLRSEGTVRGVGGLSIDRHCATNVPGLFAAAMQRRASLWSAPRQVAAGPMRPGRWRPATSPARRHRPSSLNSGTRTGCGAGRQPAVELRPEGARDRDLVSELTAAVQAQMLPLDRNYFRTGSGLEASRDRLDAVRRAARRGLASSALQDADKTRETVAMLATARLVLAALSSAAKPRTAPSAGFPQTDPAQPRRLLVGGLDRVWVRPGGAACPSTQAPARAREEALAS